MNLPDVLGALQTGLAKVAPVEVGRKGLGRHGAPPRYVIVLDAVGDGVAVPFDEDAGILRWDQHRVAVHCWASSILGATQMRRALVQVIGATLGGLPFAELSEATWGDDSYGTNGWLLVQQLAFSAPCLECVLPTDSGGDPATSITDATRATVTIEDAQISGDDAAAGDGFLDLAGEP